MRPIKLLASFIDEAPDWCKAILFIDCALSTFNWAAKAIIWAFHHN